MLTRDEILSAQDLPVETVKVRAWKGEVRVRTLNGEDREAFEVADYKAGGKHRNARLVAWCVIDENGERLFKDDDVEALTKKNGDAVLELVLVAKRLNGMMPGEVEEAVKN